MCQIIWDHATMTGNFDEEEDIACILFKDIFSLYSKISGNVSWRGERDKCDEMKCKTMMMAGSWVAAESQEI